MMILGPLRVLLCRVRRDSLLRNSLFMMATTAVSSLLGYIYWTVATRTYSVQDVGLSTALIAAMTMTSILSNVGLGSALVQTLPQREPGDAWSLTLNGGLIGGALAGLFTGTLVAVALPFLSPQFAVLAHGPGYTLAFAVGVSLWTVFGLLSSAFVAERAAGNSFVCNALFALLKIPLLIAAFLFARSGALGVLGSWVISAGVAVIVSLLVLVPRLGRGYRPVLRGTAGQVRSMLSLLAGHHLTNLGGVAPMYLLPVLVTVRLSAADNGYFYTTWMLGSLFFMVSPSVAVALFAEGAHASEGMAHKVRSSTALITILLLPTMLVFLLGGRYILAVFGPTYPRHGILLLSLLVISAVPDAITNVCVSVLRVRRRLRAAALLNLGMAALTMALAWLLLPPLGIAGAGWAWLGAQTAGSIIIVPYLILTRSSPMARGPGLPIHRMDTMTLLSDRMEKAVHE